MEYKCDVPPNVLFLGDSIAEGYGLDGFETDKYSCDSYANILRDRYATQLKGKCETTMINDAVSGDTSQQLLDHLNSGEFDECLAKSDAVVISIGGNDILEIFLGFLNDNFVMISDENGTTVDWSNISLLKIGKDLYEMSDKIDVALEKFNTNIQSISNYINSKTDGVVVVQTLYNPLDQLNYLQSLENMAEEKIAVLNQYIKDNASTDTKENYIVADVAPLFIGKAEELTNISDFDIHPNIEGHRVIADCVDKTLRTQKYTCFQEIEIEPAKSDDSSATKKMAVIAGMAGILSITALFIRKTVQNRKD